VRITVVALGKNGLPLAVPFASKGHEILGVDVNPTSSIW
jgi:UDP-N-acetyl-D-mannosaminuronate dehydrogenase